MVASTAAAPFTLPSITDSSQSISLDDYRGQVVYLDFWSSWCAPCRESLPLLVRLQNELTGSGFQVITINVDNHPRDGRLVMEKLGVVLPVASDITGRVAKEYGLAQLPGAFLIDREGRIEVELPVLNQQSFVEISAVIEESLEKLPMESVSAVN